MKKVGPLLALTAIAAAGCSGAGSSTAEPSPVRTTTSVAPAATNSPTTPSAASEGTSFRFQNVRIVIPRELESSAMGEIAPLKDDDLPWFRDPKHIKITLTYGAEDPPTGSQFAIYRVAEFRAADKENNLAKLQAFLSHSEEPVDARQLPLVPWLNATPLIAAQVEPIQFETGRGMRFVTEYAQEAAPITNRGLIYQFQGLTSDKRFYIIGVLPIRSPVLVDEAAPGGPVPDGGVPFPRVDSDRLTDYWAQITEVLDAKHSDDFSPSLETLDSLIASIEVG